MYDWTKIVGNNSLPISCCPKSPGQWDTFTCNANTPQPTTTAAPPAVQQLSNGTANNSVVSNGTPNNVPGQEMESSAIASRTLHRKRRAANDTGEYFNIIYKLSRCICNIIIKLKRLKKLPI